MDVVRLMDSVRLQSWREQVGWLIRLTRVSRRMTQGRVAEHLGWCRTTVVQIEKGRQAVSLDQLIHLAALLRVHPAGFFPLALVAAA